MLGSQQLHVHGVHPETLQFYVFSLCVDAVKLILKFLVPVESCVSVVLHLKHVLNLLLDSKGLFFNHPLKLAGFKMAAARIDA